VARDLVSPRQSPPVAADVRPEHGASSISEIWRALERVGKSSSLRRAERLVQLLKFLVETTLSGDSRYLKETTIGVSVFGRSPDYDPKTDTIVRSQAWRLRAKLSDYYASEGAEDPVVISIPKGQYAAVFTFRAGNMVEPVGISREHFPDRSRR
jgi:hypothetical protein